MKVIISFKMVSSTQKRFSIWKYFSVAECTNFAICSLCSKQVPRGGDTVCVHVCMCISDGFVSNFIYSVCLLSIA